MRRMRVLHLNHSSEAGGAEFTLRNMLRARPSWSPLLLTPPPRGVDLFADVPFRRVSGVRQPYGVSSDGVWTTAVATGSLLLQAALLRRHRAFRTADIVNANSTRAAAYAALAAWTSGVPFVVHLHDTVDRLTLGRAGLAIMSRIVLPRADGIVSNSAWTLETASRYLRPGALTTVIPSAAGLRLHENAVQPPRTTKDRPLRVGMLARIDPWKGQALLLEAFARAFPRDGATLEFAGAAPFGHEDYLAGLRVHAAALGVADRVRFLGHVVDVPGLLSRWDVAVQFSTRPEPLGQNVLQYLASGCVTVVSGEGGPAEWVADGVNGATVPPRDVAALSRTLESLCADSARRERLSAAATATPGLLDDRAVAEAHAGFYRRVAISCARRAGVRCSG